MTSCFHNERERSVGKMGELAGIGIDLGNEDILSAVVFGNIASKCIWVAARRSGSDENAPASIKG